MTQYQTAPFGGNTIHRKYLTVGDVKPNTTMRLHKRMFAHVRRKHIPVKDMSQDAMGRELSSYLINPDYIDTSSDIFRHHMTPKPVVRAVQYSRLQSTGTKGSVRQALHLDVRGWMKALARRVRRTMLYLPIGKTYSIADGLTLHRRRTIVRTTAALTTGLSILGIGFILSRQPTIERPAPIATAQNTTVTPHESQAAASHISPPAQNQTSSHSPSADPEVLPAQSTPLETYTKPSSEAPTSTPLTQAQSATPSASPAPINTSQNNAQAPSHSLQNTVNNLLNGTTKVLNTLTEPVNKLL